MRVTHNNVAKAIKAETGLDAELVNGGGYFYFVSDTDEVLNNKLLCGVSCSVMTYRISDYSVDGWVKQFKYIMEAIEEEIAVYGEISDQSSDQLYIKL